MTTDAKIAAAAHRTLADYYNAIGWDGDGDYHQTRSETLDPPKPTYADGTVAWVTDRMGTRWISVRNNGQWDSRSGDVTRDGFGYTGIVKVEPLRVLAADEIAVKRIGHVNAHECVKELKDGLVYSFGGVTVDQILDAYADALDAEAGDAK